jgi:hypothetical protein
MDREALERVADLVARRNGIDAQIGTITERPVVAGHLGESIAAQIFDIDLEASAVAKAIDGRFNSGPLAGRTVNVKLYGKREGLLDVVDDPTVEYYLVMTGPRGGAVSSRRGTRPILIEAIYLFEAGPLLAALRTRSVKIGIATSVVASLWGAAEVFPRQTNPAIQLTSEQREALSLFFGDRLQSPRDGCQLRWRQQTHNHMGLP